MKKVLLVAAVAAMAFTSCSQNEEFENVGQVEIGFNSIVKNSTRAAEVNLDGLKGKGFKVYAYNTGAGEIGTGVLDKPIMENASVTWSANKWISAKYYWPSTGNVQFFAYSSSNSSLVLTASATDKYPTIVDYTVPASASAQEDLLIAEATDKTKLSATIDFAFSHALTQVNFSIKAKDDLKYTVSEIKLSGIGNKGTYKYEDNTWTVSGSESYACAMSTTTTDNEVTGTTAMPVGTEPLMLLPQALTNAKVIVSYVVTDSKGNEFYKANDKEIAITSTWKPGKKVRYTLELTNDATEIGWTVSSVDGWSSDSNQEEDNDVTPTTPVNP